MTYKDFYTLYGAAVEAEDREMYLAEWSDSIIFYPNPDDAGPDFDEIITILENIWDVAHITVKELRARMGITQEKFAVRFCVPIRTVQTWEARESGPNYIRLMMADILGLVKVKREGW